MTKGDKVENVVEAKEKNKEIAFLKKLYEDFKETMGAVLGDGKEFVFKHKVLIAVAFIAFLIFRNKQFSIEQFVRKLEERLKGDRDW